MIYYYKIVSRGSSEFHSRSLKILLVIGILRSVLLLKGGSKEDNVTFHIFMTVVRTHTS